MKLPNASKAIIDVRKLVDYALDFDNPRGRHKARVFKAVFGLTRENADALRQLVLRAVAFTECVEGELDFYGQRYSVDCRIEFGGSVGTVRTGWIVRRDEEFPRLTTAFVLKEK